MSFRSAILSKTSQNYVIFYLEMGLQIPNRLYWIILLNSPDSFSTYGYTLVLGHGYLKSHILARSLLHMVLTFVIKQSWLMISMLLQPSDSPLNPQVYYFYVWFLSSDFSDFFQFYLYLHLGYPYKTISNFWENKYAHEYSRYVFGDHICRRLWESPLFYIIYVLRWRKLHWLIVLEKYRQSPCS